MKNVNRKCHRRLPISAFCVLLTGILGFATSVAAQNQDKIKPGQTWFDSAGKRINAHGGGVIFHNGLYYWYGEHKIKGLSEKDHADGGVHLYTSKDLVNWHDEGMMISLDRPENEDLTHEANSDRPKVVYNDKTRQFVMFFKLYLRGQGNKTGYVAVATSSSPTGPFIYRHKFLGGNSKQGTGDFAMFKDDDGSLYHLTVRKPDKAFVIGKMRDDYLLPEGEYRVAKGITKSTEAPAVIRHNGEYIMLGSGSTGWKPNAARSFSAKSIYGPWIDNGNPVSGINPHNGLGHELTFGGQSSFILKVENKEDAYIAMFDINKPEHPFESGYIWLPIELNGSKMSIPWKDQWSPINSKLSANAAEKPKHLFILAGQSNMAGLKQEVIFQPMVEEALGRENVIIVKEAVGGQSILRWYAKWDTSRGGEIPIDKETGKPGEPGDVYLRLLEKVKIAAAGKTIQTVTFIWMQGESDTYSPRSSLYKESFLGLVARLKEDLQREDINVVIGRINDARMHLPDWRKIRQDQVELAEMHDRWTWINTDDCNDGINKHGEVIKNDVHGSVIGYKTMGKRFAEAAIGLIESDGQPTGSRDQKPLTTILALGDSITALTESYRSVLVPALADKGLAVEFIGPNKDAVSHHAGYSGKNTGYLLSIVEEIYSEYPADIVMLHSGHNSFSKNKPVQGIIRDTQAIIETLRQINPRVTVLLAQVIPAGKLPKYSYIPELNKELEALAGRWSSNGSRVILVNQADGFDWKTDTSDDMVHPNASGAKKMAIKWMEALEPLLQATKEI